MVKRIISLCFVLILLGICCIPVFGADFMESDSDMFGFAYDDSKVFFTDKVLTGNNISVDNQLLNCSKLYFYIPVPKPLESLDFYFTVIKTTGSISVSACDYGTLANNAYNITASLDLPNVSWLGSNTTEGSSARSFSCKCSWSSLPFTTNSNMRFIRLTADHEGAPNNNLVLWVQKNLTQNLSGVLGNPTYSFSGLQGTRIATASSGSLTTGGYYITGSLKTKYYNGSGVVTNTGSLLNGTSGSGGYLYVPGHTISSNTSSPLKFNIEGGSISGSLTPSSVSQNTDLQGTYLDRNFINTVTMSATRGYSDQELIQAVNDASDRNHTDITNFSNRNHTDLVNIGNDLQELVDHQEQVTQAGNDIGSTTSSSSISNTSGNLSSGVSGLNSTLSTASDVSSFVTASTPYISFIGAFLPVVLNFGNGVLAWAVVAIIAVTVFLYILKKVSE